MKIKIKLHSAIDIITNSSSEIFTFQTDKNKEFIVDLINTFCKLNSLNFKCSVNDFEIDDLSMTDSTKNSIEDLTEKGFTIIKPENLIPLPALVMSIDRDEIYVESLYSLKDYLINTLNAECTYD